MMLKYISTLFIFSLFSFSLLAQTTDEIKLKAKLCSNEIRNIDFNQKKSIEDAFQICLTNYIQIKTINSLANEHLAVLFFEDIFIDLDIPSKRIIVSDLENPNKSRMNLVATLNKERQNFYDWTQPGNPSIILLNHTDVVDANPLQWEDRDLIWSGAVKGSSSDPNKLFIWGRGALDMKGIAITQLISMWQLKTSSLTLKRDIHFLAVADEEGNGAGAIGALKKFAKGEELFALNSASIVLNEGGGAMVDAPKKGTNLFLLAVEEKGGAWLKFRHKNPLKVIEDLYKSKLLLIDDKISYEDQKILDHGCELKYVITPQSKVNVVASEVIASFLCNRTFPAKKVLTSVFSHNFKTVDVKIDQHESLVNVQVSTASSSHGSVGINESAIDAFALGLYHLDLLKISKNKFWPNYFEYIKTKATTALIKGLRSSNFLLNIASRLSFIPAVRRLLLKEIETSFGVDGLFRTTCHFSAFNFNTPEIQNAEALVDCRLLHTAMKVSGKESHAEYFRNEVYKKINDQELEISIISGWDVSQSTVFGQDFNLMKNILQQHDSVSSTGKNIAVPYMFPAGTDSTWFRNPHSAGIKGVDPIPSYGFFPIFLNEELVATFHGSNERFPVDQIYGTVMRYYDVVGKLATTKAQPSQQTLIHELERMQVKHIDHEHVHPFQFVD